MNVEIKRIEARRVLCLHHVGPYAAVGAAWQKLCMFAGPKGLLGPDTKMFGLAYDDPDKVPADELRYDACLAFTGDDPVVEQPFEVKELPAGEHATALHKGPYENLRTTYESVFGEWLPQSGRTPSAGPCVEVYLNNPESTSPEDLLTEVCIPLAAS